MKGIKKIISNWWPVMGLFLGVSLAFNIIQKQNAIRLAESQAELNNVLQVITIEKDSLKVANDSIQSILNEYMFLVDSLDVLVEGNKRQLTYLNYKLTQALNKIDELSPDDIYDAVIGEYLDASSTIVSSSETYSFTEDQTKEILKDAIRVNYLDSMVIEQRKMVQRMHTQMILKDDIISTLEKDNHLKNVFIERLYRDLSNTTIQLDLSEADNRRLKKALRLWQTGSIGAGGALLLILLIL